MTNKIIECKSRFLYYNILQAIILQGPRMAIISSSPFHGTRVYGICLWNFITLYFSIVHLPIVHKEFEFKNMSSTKP